MGGGEVIEKDKFCKIPAAQREAACSAGCKTASRIPAKQQECAYGCEYWEHDA